MTLAVTLDAGNTLLHSDPSPPVIYAEHMSRLGSPVDPDQAAGVFSRTWASMQLELKPGTDRYHPVPGGEQGWWHEFVRRVVAELEHDAPVQPLFRALYGAFTDPAIWRVYPEVVPALEELRGQGLRLAVVSNWDSRLPRLLSDLGLTTWFDTIVVSAVEGVEKPAAGIFQRAAEQLGVPRGEIVHVGDSPREDYYGALEAGLQAVLVDRRGVFREDGFSRVSDLSELPSLLAQAREVAEET
jgi:putative hydrolase of the HAD superfamily